MDTAATDRAAAEASASEPWRPDRLDLAAYLARIGYSGALAAEAETLIAIHRAQVATIPFENLDVLLGCGISVELPAIEAKLVRAGRGGYCYEHGLLLAAALERLGFQVTRLLARTNDPVLDPRPRTHLVLRVRLDDLDWLADAGFGSGLLEPVPMIDSGRYQQGGWSFQVWRGDDGGWRLQEWRSHRWETLYTVLDEATYPVDVATANYLTSMSPGSPFVRQLVVTRKDDEQLRELIGRQYSVRRPDGTSSTSTVPASALGDRLAELGLAIPAADIARIAGFQPPPAASNPA